MAASGTSVGDGLTPAQKMMQQHQVAEDHQPMVEDVVDEEDIAHPPPSDGNIDNTADSTPTLANGATMSEKALGKQKASTTTSQNTPSRLDTQSEEAFPSLGPSKAKAPATTTWGSKPTFISKPNGNNNTRVNGASKSGDPNSVSTPSYVPSRSSNAYAPRGPAQNLSLPGKHTEDMRMRSDQLRQDLRRPIADLLRDINKKSKASVEMRRADGFVTFRGTGPNVDTVRQVLKDVAVQIGEKQSIKVPIPASLRAHVIGKGGSTIKNISESTGARIQMPKAGTGPADDDDEMVDIEIEGNPVAVVLARNALDAIVNQRTSTVNLKMKDVPAEYFAHLAGPRNSRIESLVGDRDLRVKIPHYHTWQSQAPTADQPSNLKPQDGFHIHISGERDAAKQMQAELERQVKELQGRIALQQIPIEQARHQFIGGDHGESLHDFFEETGCSIVFPPPGEDTEMITIVGPSDRLETGINKAMDLASSMYMQSVDVARQHPGVHSQDLARYLRQRQALQQFENQYDAQVTLPLASESSGPWQIFARDPKNAMRARTDIMNLVNGHPPSRFKNVSIHPFYQRDLQSQHARAVRDQHGIHVVVPEDVESDSILLVYEGDGPASEYTLPRKQPTAAEAMEFERALQGAETFLLDLVGAQEEIVSRSVETPQKYYEKLHKYLTREQQREQQQQQPVQLMGTRASNGATGQNLPVEFRGPATAVNEYEQLIAAFIEAQIRDEAERDYTISFDFPQKFANFLIGKKGENINKLRDEFDVDIQVNDGKVEVKGPKSKADAAKAHILSLGRKLEDETTHTLRINPKFHREMIGAKGNQVLRLQDRYGVRIMFPRSAVDDRASEDGASDAGAATRRRGPPQAADEVIIKGPRKGVDEARDELWNLYTYTQDISHTATVSIAQSQIPSIIGQGGRELQALRETTGAEVDIPGKDEVDDSGRVEVKIKGKKAAVENAKRVLQEKAKAFDESVTKNLDIDRKYHRGLIGREGENIRQIILSAGGSGDNRELARMVQFPKVDAQDNSIRVEGKQDVVDKIIEAIESFVQLRENQTTETIEVAPEKHGVLIGRRGETRKSIESNHNVTLQIPSTSTTGIARSRIQISGMPADVQKAKERILGMVKEQQGETIQIPVRLHHSVADTNGNIFQSLKRDLRVTVDHAGQTRPQRPQIPKPTFTNASTKNSNLPLITDDTAGSTSAGMDAQDDHYWEIVGAVPVTSGDESTVPWILRGPNAEAVTRARQQIEAALAAAEQSVTGYLVLPDPKTYRFVIGQGGATVNGIRSNTGCKIDVPKAGGGKNAIEITGLRDQVEEAKEMVLEAVLSAQSRR